MTFGVAGLARHAGIAALFVAAALLGTLSGVLFAYSGDLPQISALDSYAPNTITRVLGKDVNWSATLPSNGASSSATTRFRCGCARRCWPPRIPVSSITSGSIRNAC